MATLKRVDPFRPLSKFWGFDVARFLRYGWVQKRGGQPAALDRQLCYTDEAPRPEFVEWARRQGLLRVDRHDWYVYRYYVPLCGLTVAWDVQYSALRRREIRDVCVPLPSCRVTVSPWRLNLSGAEIVELLRYIFPHPENIWVSSAELCLDLPMDTKQVFRSLRVKYARQSSINVYQGTTMYFHRPRSKRRVKTYDKRHQAHLDCETPLTRIEVTTNLPKDKPLLIDMLMGRWLPKEDHWRNVLLYDVSGLDARRLKGGLQRAWHRLTRREQQSLKLWFDLGAEWLRRHLSWLRRNMSAAKVTRVAAIWPGWPASAPRLLLPLVILSMQSSVLAIHSRSAPEYRQPLIASA